MLRYSHSQHQRGSARAAVLVSAAAAFGLLGFADGARAQTLYWDVNGANPGATDGTTASGLWDGPLFGPAFWTTDPSGSSATTTFVDRSAVAFSAGSNATGPSVIEVGFNIRTSGFTVEEGSISLTGSSIDNGTSPALIMPGATLTTGGRFSHSGPLTIDGGTLRNPVWPAAVQLTANGATFDTAAQQGSSGYSLSQPITLAAGTTAATLTKTGPGRFTMRNAAAFTTLNVNEGVYLASGDLGFGAASGTVNVADGAFVGAAGSFVSPATRTFVLAGNGTFCTDSGPWTINSAITGPGRFTLDEVPPIGVTPRVTLAGTNTYQGSTSLKFGTLVVAGGNAIPDTSPVVFDADFGATLELEDNETVGSIASAQSSARIRLSLFGRTLTVGADNTSTRFAGNLDLSSGGLTKIGTGKLTVETPGFNSVGTLTVKEGTFEVASGSISAGRVIVGDNSGATAILSIVPGSNTFLSPELTVNGPGASVVLGPIVTGSGQTFRTVALKNGARITGSASSIVRAFQTFDVESGSIDVILATARSDGTGGTLNKTTPGTVTLNGLNTYTGGTNVAEGTLRAKRLHENNAVNIAGGKLQVMDSSPTLPAHPSGDNAFVSRPSSLTIANDGATLGARTYNGQLDLTNNDLILDYAADGPNPAAEIEDMVRGGYNGGDWLGNGIASSTANADRNFAIGVADNARLAIPYGDGTTGWLFSGQAVDPTTILVKFTHRIDLDLDGVVTTNDATIFNSNYSEGAPAYWSIGDLDYDRVFTSNDATIFNSFYNESVAGVPEPGVALLLSSVGVAVACRRRRRAGGTRQPWGILGRAVRVGRGLVEAGGRDARVLPPLSE